MFFVSLLFKVKKSDFVRTSLKIHTHACVGDFYIAKSKVWKLKIDSSVTSSSSVSTKRDFIRNIFHSFIKAQGMFILFYFLKEGELFSLSVMTRLSATLRRLRIRHTCYRFIFFFTYRLHNLLFLCVCVCLCTLLLFLK